MATHAARMRKLYPYLAPSTTADHIVIGGGAIGLAVAAGLANTAGKNRTTFLVERNSLCEELRGHPFRYPVGSLRSKFCIRGRDLLYARCQKLGIGHRQTEKLIVATERYQINFLDHLSTISADPSLHNGEEENPYTSSSTVPCWFLSPEQARELEPDLSRHIQGALLVTSTGIVDSQGLVDSLAREVEEEDYAGPSSVGSSDVSDVETTRGYGAIIRGTRVVRIDRDEKGKGWVVQLEGDWEGKAEGEKGEISSVQADVVINAAGLAAVSLTEGLIPASEQVKLYTVKGNYMSYKGPGVSNVSRLIYPCPSRDISALGTHLTMDLNGNIKFGPDVDPIGDPETSMRDPDFWKANLTPSADRIASIAQSAQSYLPGIDPAGLSPDYSGVRPNIAPPGSGFSDFLIRHSPERKGLIELLGFASPGLTSSLAVGEHVARMVRKDVWREKSSVESLAEGWE